MNTMTYVAPAGSRALLARILDQRDLPAQIQALPPAVLGKLVGRVGLEDAGEIVALATTEQIAHMFDEDLWKSERPGEDERFDPARFLVWLEVMMEAGDTFVAERLTELPEDLVTLALHRHLLVLSTDALAAEIEAAGDDADPLEKALDSCLYEELDDHQIIARSPDGWDTLLSTILALDRDHHEYLTRVLDRCHHLSAGEIDDRGGLYEVLTSEEMLEADVAGDREDRRAASGHVAPSAAKSFLALATMADPPSLDEHDAVTRAYLRGLSRMRVPAPRPPLRRAGSPAAAPRTGLLEVLRDTGVIAPPEATPLLPAGPGARRAAEEPLVIRALRLLGEEDPALFAERSEEMAYLANVLIAGCVFQRRRLRPIEAVRAAVATCSLGLSMSVADPPAKDPVARAATSRDGGDGAALARAVAMLRRRPADGLFRLAWRRLSEEIVTPASALVARRDLDLDAAGRRALAALADGCPSLAGALAEVGAPGARDDDARFVSAPGDLAAARRFLDGLARATGRDAPARAAGRGALRRAAVPENTPPEPGRRRGAARRAR